MAGKVIGPAELTKCDLEEMRASGISDSKHWQILKGQGLTSGKCPSGGAPAGGDGGDGGMGGSATSAATGTSGALGAAADLGGVGVDAAGGSGAFPFPGGAPQTSTGMTGGGAASLQGLQSAAAPTSFGGEDATGAQMLNAPNPLRQGIGNRIPPEMSRHLVGRRIY